ncbi:cytochrome P450 monooxygenase [Aspergillus luchuensis]|uniref:Cytochrome P450 monooxygenase n=1 Tax=Aspergillus kawachii TaxID=1069201 RepID=A0A146FKI2_ASPKA|nr:cytochrome P450 monooxygenase [Aspergillus luchuensis]
MEKEAVVISGQEVTPLQDVLVIGEPTGILRFVVPVLPLKVGRTATEATIAGINRCPLTTDILFLI